MPTQSELLAALDRAISIWMFAYADQKQAAQDAATLTALRDQIAKGPVAESHSSMLRWLVSEDDVPCNAPLYALTGADQ